MTQTTEYAIMLLPHINVELFNANPQEAMMQAAKKFETLSRQFSNRCINNPKFKACAIKSIKAI